MNIEVFPAVFVVNSDPAAIARIHEHFSFIDKAAEYQLKRFLKSCAARENGGSVFPGYDAWKERELLKLQSKVRVHCGERPKPDVLEMPLGLWTKFVDYLGYTPEVTDTRNFNLVTKKLTKSNQHLIRPYQKEAVEAAIKHGSGVIEIATGTGKTFCGELLIAHHGVRSIFLAPSKPILDQTYERFCRVFGKSNVGYYGAGKRKHSHITVATYQSVYSSKDPKEFVGYDAVFFDEAHHIPADTFFEVAQKKLSQAVYRVGLSADVERADGATILVEAGCGPIIYSYPAPQAIADGYLAKPTFQIYEVYTTAGTYIQWKQEDGKRTQVGVCDSEPIQKDDAHRAYKNWVVGNDKLTKAIAELASGFAGANLNVLILVDETEHGDKLMDSFSSTGAVAEFVYGGRKENSDSIKRFNERELKIIVGTSTIGEGADTVCVDVLINLMGGTQTKQANGRALRNDPDPVTNIPRKPTCLIIDFDFPNNPALHRHFESRCEVHQTYGPVHYSRLL